MKNIGIIAILLVAGCEPAPSAPPPAVVKAGPHPGILVLNPGPLPPELTKEALYRPGLPSFGLKVEYSGPKSAVRTDVEGFEKGNPRASSKSVRRISLPLVAELGFGFGEGTNTKNELQAAAIHTFGVTSAGAKSTTRDGSAGTQGITPIGERRCQTWQPAWPLEIADGQEAIVWAVFVAEPEGDREAIPIPERAKQAEAAWIFKVSSSEMPKE